LKHRKAFLFHSDKVTKVHDKVVIDGDPIRNSLKNAINKMQSGGGTCLGDGLMGGMDVNFFKNYQTSFVKIFVLFSYSMENMTQLWEE